MSLDRTIFSLKNLVLACIYLSAFALFAYQVKDVLSKYFNKLTTIAINEQVHKALPVPVVTFCANSQFKPSVVKARSDLAISGGNQSMFSALLYNDTGTPSFFENATYKLGKDFTMRVELCLGGFPCPEANLKIGHNTIIHRNESISVKVNEITSFTLGLCYSVQVEQALEDQHTIKFFLELSNDMGTSDLTGFKAMLTHKTELIAVMINEWQSVKRFEVPLQIQTEATTSLIRTSKKLLEEKGHCQQQYLEDCRMIKLSNAGRIRILENCTNPCSVPSWKSWMDYNNQSSRWKQCNNINDSKCVSDIVTELYYEKAIACLPPCVQVEFNGINQFENKHGTKRRRCKLKIYFETMREEIFEQILLYDASSFIGNVGGYLGLFVGFSYLDFATSLFVKLMDLLSKRKGNL